MAFRRRGRGRFRRGYGRFRRRRSGRMGGRLRGLRAGIRM